MKFKRTDKGVIVDQLDPMIMVSEQVLALGDPSIIRRDGQRLILATLNANAVYRIVEDQREFRESIITGKMIEGSFREATED
jgi:hypothetical protein